MALYYLPLMVVELAVLVEDVRVYGDLADVVEQGGPAKAVSVCGRKVEFVGNEVGVGTHTFPVTARQTVVRIESRREGQDLLGRHYGLIDVPLCSRFVYAAREVPRRAGSSREGEALRCLIGKDHRHLQEHRQRQGTPGETVGCQENQHRNT